MRPFLFSVIVLFTTTLKAQEEQPKKFEFGPELATFNGSSNSYYNLPDKKKIQVFPGITFNYFKNRMGFRSGINFSNDYTTTETIQGCADCITGESRNMETKARAGFQYNLIRTKQWLYAFTDLYYRNLFSKGTASGGITGATRSFTLNSNGIGAIAGIGFKFKIYKLLTLSPELYYDGLNGFNTTTENDTFTGLTTVNNTSIFNLQTGARLFAAVKF